MQISEKWLREWVNPAVDSDQLAETLSMLGLEVDAVTAVAPDFSGVVVARVISCEPHPNADRLSVCRVDIGEQEPRTVVCGAPNVRAGLTVAFVNIGGVLPGEFQIKKTTLRGVESHGMICSARELGLGDADQGIMELAADAPIGTDFRDYFSLDDHVIHIDLTPNRGDCASVRGVARDLAAKFQMELTPPTINSVDASHRELLAVHLSEPSACPRYSGRIIRGIAAAAQTPLWMQERLRRSGLRTIHPVVDIGNYVMLELGQPVHAFDLAKLQGDMTVRFAHLNEKMTLLDGREVTLTTENLVIADSCQAQALAGIMGAASSAVDNNTQDVFLESAYFTPPCITRSARQLTISTDASYRFERGVDATLQTVALERFTQLLCDICGGEVGDVIEYVDTSQLPAVDAIVLRRHQLKRTLGMTLADDRIVAILSALGCQLTTSDQGWLVSPPSYRHDLSIESDLLEELARINGYDQLPASQVSNTVQYELSAQAALPYLWLPRLLVALGYHEAINYSFIAPELQAHFANIDESLVLTNPLAKELSVMRASLWPGLLKSLKYNVNRQCSRVRLFETGLCFRQHDGVLEQVEKVAAVIAGNRHDLQWSQLNQPVDFFDIKGDVQHILASLKHQATCEWRKSTCKALHPGQAADLFVAGKWLGSLGALHPAITRALDLSVTPYLFELNLSMLNEVMPLSYQDISKFPAVCRDLAIVIDEGVSAQLIEHCIKQSAGHLLLELTIFDIYQGEGIAAGKKSVALGLVFQDRQATLVDDHINEIIERIMVDLQQAHNAVMRI